MNKTISFFWGNEKMSFLRYMTLWSFRKLNPDWEMRLYICKQQRTTKYWTEHNEQDFFTYKGKDYTSVLSLIPNLQVLNWEIKEKKLYNLGPSHKSNFFKWELMCNESGVYADMDIVFVKPIDDWFNYVCDSDVGIGYSTYFSIGLLSSSGNNNNFYRTVYDNAVKHTNQQSYQSAGVDAIYRLLGHQPGHWNRIIQQFPSVNFTKYDMDYVAYYDSMQVNDIVVNKHTNFPANTFGIHWYAGHPDAQRLNNLLTDCNYKDYHNTLTHFIGQIL